LILTLRRPPSGRLEGWRPPAGHSSFETRFALLRMRI
jgi:hypothetical protein